MPYHLSPVGISVLKGRIHSKNPARARSVVAVIAWGCLFPMCLSTTHSSPAREETVATINGEPVRITELRHWMLLNRAEVYRYFYQNHQVRDAFGFWEKTYNGVSPAGMLREKALQDVVHHKVQQILAKNHGIVPSIDFDKLMEDMESENRTRRQKIDSGQVVYGNSSYTRQTFFAQKFDQMVEDLKAHLAQTDFKLDEKSLEESYHKHVENIMPPKPELDKIKGLLQMKHVDKQYTRRIDEMKANAKIEINSRVFDHVRAWESQPNAKSKPAP